MPLPYDSETLAPVQRAHDQLSELLESGTIMDRPHQVQEKASNLCEALDVYYVRQKNKPLARFIGQRNPNSSEFQTLDFTRLTHEQQAQFVRFYALHLAYQAEAPAIVEEQLYADFLAGLKNLSSDDAYQVSAIFNYLTNLQDFFLALAGFAVEQPRAILVVQGGIVQEVLGAEYIVWDWDDIDDDEDNIPDLDGFMHLIDETSADIQEALANAAENKEA